MNGPAIAPVLVNNEREEWNRVHAQLLKSVADAQAKLLAAQNETTDRLERMDRDLRVLIAQTQETVRNSHGNISGRLNELKEICVVNGSMLHQIGTELPRRLRPKRIVKRAVERKRRQ